MAYIILYADDFTTDVWEEYCEICKEEPSAISLTITFDEFENVKAEYEEDKSCNYICNLCGEVFYCENDDDFDDNVEEILWHHIEMEHEEEFEEYQNWETPYMIEEYFEREDS